MEFWFRKLCFFILLSFSVIIISVSSLQESDCTEFQVIPPDQYDRNASSAEDLSKRPLGYILASVQFPGVQSNIKNPCVYLKNLTSRDVEIMIQTVVPGNSVCVRDDRKPTPKSGCTQGGLLSMGCWNPTTDTVIFEFYCDPGMGCNTDVQFWYRLTPSPPGADIDKWCLARNSEFPQDLKTAPPVVRTKPTAKSTASGLSSWSCLFTLVFLLVRFQSH